MSKAGSGLFSGTNGASIQALSGAFAYPSDESTAVVWNHIEATAENYPNTPIPRSFAVDVPKTAATPDGRMWTHGNATEHMYEAMISLKENPMLKNSNPTLYSQFVLYDYYKSLGQAVSNGVKFSGTVTVGNWEFAFSQARSGQKYPVVKHALFNGLQK